MKDDDRPTRDPLEQPTMMGRVPVVPPDEEAGQPCLVVIGGGEIGRQSLIGASLLIGRSSAAGLRLEQPAVSRRHARLERLPDGHVELVDLGSANGVWLNGERVQRAVLCDGDRLQVGDTVLRFTRVEPAERGLLRRVHQRVHFDELTGLETMESLLGDLERSLARGRGVLSIAMSDLDGLREVNTLHGHGAGRAVVGAMGAAFRGELRRPERAGLYGGDETLVLFPGLGLAAAKVRAEALRAAVAAMEVPWQATRLRVTVSLGLAEGPRHGTSLSDLVAAADRALYAAKRQGRNRVATADELTEG